jgi:hypothetical protein
MVDWFTYQASSRLRAWLTWLRKSSLLFSFPRPSACLTLDCANAQTHTHTHTHTSHLGDVSRKRYSAAVQGSRKLSRTSAGFMIFVVCLFLTPSVKGAGKTRPWRNVGFNSVLDDSPGSREYGRMVSLRDMLFLWGGKNPVTNSGGECEC